MKKNELKKLTKDQALKNVDKFITKEKIYTQVKLITKFYIYS